MGAEKNVQTVKDFFAAIGRGDKKGLLALVAENIEWIIPGKDWPLAGTYRGHAGLSDLLESAARSIETSAEPGEFVAQGDQVLAPSAMSETNAAYGRWDAGTLGRWDAGTLGRRDGPHVVISRGAGD